MNGRVSKTLSVGFVTAGSLAIIALGVFLVGREQRFWEGRIEYALQFSRTNGLTEGAPVLLDGVNVGSVTSMRFPPDPTARYVEVRIAVSEDVASRIRRDTTARIQTLGLLGDKYVELSSGTLQTEPVRPGELIASIDPVDYEEILGQSGDIVTNVIEVTALLRQVLTDINEGRGLIGRLVSDREFGKDLADNVSLTVSNLESATSRLDLALERVEAGQGPLGALLAEDDTLDTTLANLQSASENMLKFSDELRHGRGFLPRLTSDEKFAEQTLSNIERATSSIAEVADRIRSGRGTLGRLVYEEDLYNDARALVGGGGGLWGMIWRFIWPFSGGAERGAQPVEVETAGPRSHRPQERFRP